MQWHGAAGLVPCGQWRTFSAERISALKKDYPWLSPQECMKRAGAEVQCSQFFILFDIYGNNAFQWGQAHNLDRRTFLRRERKRAVTEARNRMYAAQRREAVTKLLLVTKSLAGIVLAYCRSLALVLIYVYRESARAITLL